MDPKNTPPYETQRSLMGSRACRGIVSSMSFVRDGEVQTEMNDDCLERLRSDVRRFQFLRRQRGIPAELIEDMIP